MKSKGLVQSLVLLTLLLAPFGANQPARASTSAVDNLNSQNIDHNFPALQEQPSVSMVVNPSSVNVGEIATVTVNLNNVPGEGYTSTELTCTYDPDFVEASNIVIGNLFGIDPVTAINGPHNGQFIVAIAGSDGKKAISSGVILAFNVRGLQAGQSSLECRARVSQGDHVLTQIASNGANVYILAPTVTPTFRPTPCDKAEFIADINVPPGTVMSPGAQFRKTWRLKNIGSCTWTTSYRLAFLSGEQMGGPSSIRFSIPVAPGQMVDLTLEMTAPSVSGSYRGYWIFQNSTGSPFGVGSLGNEPWFVDIVVSSATAISTPTAAQSQSPAPFTPTAMPSELTATQTPITSITPTAERSPTFTPTSFAGLTPTVVTGTPMPAVSLLMGRVFASKPVRIEAYIPDNNLVGAGWVNPDGSFEFQAPSGTNTVIAMASGFLSARRSVTITDGSRITLPTISLIAGDIDGNHVIDQFDAMTIGMSYNADVPSVADLNNDGIINVLDLELLAHNFRKSGPVAWE